VPVRREANGHFFRYPQTPVSIFVRKILFENMFRVAVLYPISLAPGFSEVHGRVCYHNRFSGLLVH